MLDLSLIPLSERIVIVRRLAEANAATAEDRLHEIYGWHFERAFSMAKATIGGAASFAVALVLSQFKGELQIPGAWSALAIVALAIVVAYGFLLLLSAWRIGDEYSQVLELLKSLP